MTTKSESSPDAPLPPPQARRPDWLIENLAMLVKQLVRRLQTRRESRSEAGDYQIATNAYEFLVRHNIEGSILRAESAPQEAGARDVKGFEEWYTSVEKFLEGYPRKALCRIGWIAASERGVPLEEKK